MLAFTLCAAGSRAAEEALSGTGLELANPNEVLLTVNAGAHASKHGLTPQLLQSRIAPKLVEAGIRHTNFAAAARLEVMVDADSTGSFFSLVFNLHRPVRIEAGSRTYRALGVTWNRALQGSFHQQTNVVLAVAERLTDEFLLDHKKANPYATLRGRVVASDPKFLFVVINLGSDHGLKAEQELIVERRGETVAHVRVKTINTDHSIANVLPTPVPQDILEGDEVLPKR